ncbi:hypothetical protein KSC_072130 [Ktedonobacter sp. SOSP1-52]|nr:hypothetical protein KSC_072130 [Ktedonobacter sp. SOSP1-52]
MKRLLKRQIELVVIADIHHLANSGEQFELLVSIFQTGSMMPLLIIGEPSQMRHVLAQNERFLWRFPPCSWINTLGLVSRGHAGLCRYRSLTSRQTLPTPTDHFGPRQKTPWSQRLRVKKAPGGNIKEEEQKEGVPCQL